MTERLVGLLREVVGLLRLAEETPLAGGVDCAGIAAASIERCRIRTPEGAPTLSLPTELEAGLDTLLATVCREEALPFRPDLELLPDRSISGPLASWLARRYPKVRATHPRTASILTLRLEGLDHREIATRLDLGPRLVRRILLEVASQA